MFEKVVEMTELVPNESTPPKQGRNVVRNRLNLEGEKEYVLDAKKKGKSIRTIAAESEAALGYPLAKSTVQERLEAAIADIKVPLVEDVRAMEIERMDYYLDRLQSKIEDGDDKAIATAMRIAERRAKLLGADAPVNIQAVVANVDITETPFGQVLQQQYKANQEAEVLLAEEEDDEDV